MILCQTYSSQGQFAEAIAECEKARRLNDEIRPCVVSSSRAYAGSGKRNQAMKSVGEMHELAKETLTMCPRIRFGLPSRTRG